MRLLELKLSEAALGPKELRKYPWRRTLFLNKINNRSPFTLNDGGEVIVDPSEAARITALFNADDINAVGNIKTDKGDYLLSKFKKTPEFVKEPKAGEEQADVSEFISNRGDVSEGILSAALFAKLTARSRGEILDITAADIWRVVDALSNVGTDRYSVTVRDAAKTVVKDNVVFTIILPEPAYLDFVDPAKRQLMASETSSAVMFANSDDNREFSEYFYLNGKPDTIEIICDGGNPAKQKTSKVDIEVVVTDQLTGRKNRKRLNISLKAQAKQFGQLGAGSTSKQDFFEKQTELWNRFGVDIEPVRRKFDAILAKGELADAIGMVYKYAASSLNEVLAGDNDEDEYLYLRDLVSAINFYATLNTPGIMLVNFKGGGYEIMSFDSMESKLHAVDLAAKYSTSTKWPQVEVYDKNSGEQLLQIRLKVTADERRNYIEKGPLMTTLLGTSVKPVKVRKIK
jgi:hypothetical protein